MEAAAARVAQQNVVAAGVVLGRAAEGAFLVVALVYGIVVLELAAPAAKSGSAWLQWRRRPQRRGQTRGTKAKTRMLTLARPTRQSRGRCLPASLMPHCSDMASLVTRSLQGNLTP